MTLTNWSIWLRQANSTSDNLETAEHPPNGFAPWAALLSIFPIVTILGNSLVTYAVLTKSYLHTPTGSLIVSLAIADLIVGTCVMPFNVALQVTNQWKFGLIFCDIWHCLDVLASTASIWSLCVISLDR